MTDDVNARRAREAASGGERDICRSCGFDKNLPRRVVLLCDNILSFATYLEMQCDECGHISDGSTIVAPSEDGHVSDSEASSVSETP